MKTPNNNTQATPTPCYAHRHMTAAEYGFWDVCRALAHKTGTLYFNGDDIAKRFSSMARSTTYNLARSLVANGWFKEIKAPKRGAGGLWSSRHYKVLSHAEWVAEHPDSCPSPVQFDDDPVQDSVLETFPPVQFGDDPVQSDYKPVQNLDSPVHSGVHNLIEILPTKKQPPTELSDTRPPIQNIDAFIDKFSGKTVTKAAEAASAHDTRPILNSGLDDHERRLSDATEVATTIVASLGMNNPGFVERWSRPTKLLLDRGIDKQLISSVANHYIQRYGVTLVMREGPTGFEASFNRLEAEHTKKLLEEAPVVFPPDALKGATAQ
jgi:hypothetical protein